MFSVCSHLGGGVPRPGPDREVPRPGLTGGTPARSDGGGLPLQVPPLSDLAGGVPQYPTLGTPHQTWPGGGTPP